MNEELLKILQIRYVKLHFIVMFTEDSVLFPNKASALRGGIGEMLLRANCIRNRECDSCDFLSECIVQRTMYSRFEKKPDFVTSGDSVGYVLECDDYRTEFSAGDTMEFRLLLFGKTIVYLNQYLQAIFALGTHGLGKNHVRFQIVSVLNTKRQPIIEDSFVYMERYRVEMLSDYVQYRLRKTSMDMTGDTRYRIYFKTPATLKYNGAFLKEWNMEAIIAAVKRRIYIMDCFEGIEGEPFYRQHTEIPALLYQESFCSDVKRASSRKNEKMLLKGLKGFVEISQVTEEMLILLLAGELLHIGKYSSFGFGKYVVEICGKA